MDNDQERRVRERAHAILEREGRPGARHHDHWHRAVQELEAEGAAAIGPAGSGSGMAGTSPSGGASDTGSGLSSGLQPGGTIQAVAQAQAWAASAPAVARQAARPPGRRAGAGVDPTAREAHA